jgi:hypothetical protein
MFLSKAVRPAPSAVRPARAGNLDEVIFDYRAIERTRVFERKKRKQKYIRNQRGRYKYTDT